MDKQTVTDTHNGILFSLKKEKNSDTYSNMDETWRHWKWKWSHSVVSDSLRPHGLQPTRLLHPWDFPGKSTGMGCHCLLRDQPRQHIKKQGHYFVNKGPSNQGYGFSSGHVWMWEFDLKKAECQRIDAFELSCWIRLLRVPWTTRKSTLNIHWKDWCWSYNTLAPDVKSQLLR